MKLQAIKNLHDEIMASVIKEFNAHEGLAPTMFLAEVLDNGKVKDVTMVPDEVASELYRGDPEEINSLVEDALTDGTPLHKSIKANGIAVNLVMQVAEATLKTRDDPQERRGLMCLLTQPEGSFFVAHPIEDTPVVHCVQAEFPAFENIRFNKAVAKGPGEEKLARPTVH